MFMVLRRQWLERNKITRSAFDFLAVLLSMV